MACDGGPSVRTHYKIRKLNMWNIVFEQPNMKGNHAWIEWYAFKCYHILNWFFLPKPGFLEFIWILSSKNHFKLISPTFWIQILPNEFH